MERARGLCAILVVAEVLVGCIEIVDSRVEDGKDAAGDQDGLQDGLAPCHPEGHCYCSDPKYESPRGYPFVGHNFCPGSSHSFQVYPTTFLGRLDRGRYRTKPTEGGTVVSAVWNRAEMRWFSGGEQPAFYPSTSGVFGLAVDKTFHDGITSVWFTPSPSEGRTSIARALCVSEATNGCVTQDCLVTVYGTYAGTEVQYSSSADDVQFNMISLDAVLAHEFGHILGLGDTEGMGFAGSLMDGAAHGFGVEPFDASADDVQAALSLYCAR